MMLNLPAGRTDPAMFATASVLGYVVMLEAIQIQGHTPTDHAHLESR